VDRPDKKGRIEILRVHLRARCEAGADVDLGEDRGADARLHRRRPRQSGQRGGAGGDPPRRRCGDDGRFHQRGRAHRRRAGEKRKPRAESRRSAPSSPITRWGTRWWRGTTCRRRSGAESLHHPARRRRARLHHPAADRGPLPDDNARGAARIARWRQKRMAVLIGGVDRARRGGRGGVERESVSSSGRSIVARNCPWLFAGTADDGRHASGARS
jgi:hypothetical protein